MRVAETDSKFVGKGIALVDPKVIKDLVLNTGDVVEISGIRRKALHYFGQAINLTMVKN